MQSSPKSKRAGRSPSPTRADSPTHDDREGFQVRKNAKGGVLVTHEEITAAFAMLDPENTGQLTLQSLKKRLGPLLPEMSAKDYRFLMNNKKEMNVEDLRELLIENEVSNHDPMFDAFRIFDPKNTGYIDEDKLRLAFQSFGLGELSDEELEILKRVRESAAYMTYIVI